MKYRRRLDLHFPSQDTTIVQWWISRSLACRMHSNLGWKYFKCSNVAMLLFLSVWSEWIWILEKEKPMFVSQHIWNLSRDLKKCVNYFCSYPFLWKLICHTHSIHLISFSSTDSNCVNKAIKFYVIVIKLRKIPLIPLL